jgi:hypothetical protein
MLESDLVVIIGAWHDSQDNRRCNVVSLPIGTSFGRQLSFELFKVLPKCEQTVWVSHSVH